MAYSLYVNNLPPDITIDDLIIYFQSEKSGGGDVDLDASKLDGNTAVVVFEAKEYLHSVLQKQHEISGHKLVISDKPIKFRPVPKKRTSLPSTTKAQERIQSKHEKAYLGEVRTVIVSGIGSATTDEVLKMFFENTRRTGGGEIEKLERSSPDVANISFLNAEVAAEVLKNKSLELEGYRLQLKEKQPELILPLDKKKLHVENINPKTSKDGLQLYLEVVTTRNVLDVQFGDNNNALVTLEDEPDMRTVQEKSGTKPLDGADLKISNPPVCNSVLITGLNKNTTKQTIEMYFENEKNGGGKIYGDIIFQKDQGKAVVSFCYPSVVESLMPREHRLNRSMLTVHQHYQFMQTIKEITIRKIKLNADIVNHVVKNCEKKIRDLFGIDVGETVKENKEELNLPGEIDEATFHKFQEYMKKFAVKEVPFCKKFLESGKEDIDAMITKFSKDNFTLAVEEESLCIKLVGKRKDVDDVYEQMKIAVDECEKSLNVVTDEETLPEHKLQLFLLHGIDETLKNEFQVDVNIDLPNEKITIKGAEKQVSSAVKTAMTKGAQISEESIDLSENEKKFMESSGLDVLNRDLKAKGLKGMVCLCGPNRNKGKILVFDATTFVDVRSFISDNMHEKTFPLDEDSVILLKSNKWEEFYDDVTSNTSVKIYTDASKAPGISLIGTISEVGLTHQKLETFIKRNTIVKETVQFGEGCTRYVTEYCQKDLEEIGKTLEDHFVAVHTVDGGMIQIDGTKEGVKEAKDQLKEIAENIANGTMCFDKKRMLSYLESEEGKTFLAGIEFGQKCVIQLIRDDGEQSRLATATRPSTSELLCSYETREEISLKVYKGDITAHRCDVIVNAANRDLKLGGGVAGSILNVGGKEIQDECDAHVQANGSLYDGECFGGSPGNLPCKRLVHAVGPRWDSGSPEKVTKVLKVTCMKVLQEARNYQSIALPAIGSGVFGIPKQVCADVMIEAAEEFGKRYDDSRLKEIHFVNIDDASGLEFVKKFQEKFGGRPSFHRKQVRQPLLAGIRSKLVNSHFRAREIKREVPRITEMEPARRKPGDQFIITKGSMKISVVVGDLSTYKADVLVNTTGESLKLDSNPCSKALSNEAGPVLQAECSKIGKLQVGDVAVTQGGNLLCDEVYHVVCVQWNNGDGERVLRSIIKNCLKTCNTNGKKSIAFPAIGTGILGFPHDVAATLFFEETKKFGQRVGNSVRDVSFVVYNQDGKSIQAFKNALKKQAEWGKNAPPTTASPTAGPNEPKGRRRKKRGENAVPTATNVGTNNGDVKECETRIEVGDDKEVEIVKGDITKESTDVIAHLTNLDLKMLGGVASALARSGGHDIERECKKEVRSVKLTDTVLTTAGRLNAKYVAHMVASDDPDASEIEKCIENCLKKVMTKGCKSISFPAVGTGQLKYGPEKAARAILTSILRVLQSNPHSLKTVRIVLKDVDLVRAFVSSASQLQQEFEPGYLKKFINFLWKTESPTINVKERPPANTNKLFLEIYAKDDATVHAAKQKIQTIIEKQKKKEKIEDESIGNLSAKQISEITELCETHDIEFTIDKEINRIILIGHIEDISKALSEIYQILKKIGEAAKEMEKAALHEDLAEIVSQGVQWFWVDSSDDDEPVEYDKRTNAMIEKAYSKKEKSSIFILGDEQLEIVFDKMQENNLKTSKKTKVIRKEFKGEISVPDYWDPQPCDANGKELTVHLVSLDPKNPKHKDEYKKVSDHFYLTTRQPIHQVQRIQNPALYKQYATKKQSLDEKNGSNERFLFHGTRPNHVKTINESGLNRSYAGLNAIYYGKGVYFARDASYSVGYASVDPTTRKRYMYYARVAVGEYTLGNQSMLVPPQKGGNANDSYDSTVENVANPTIFVIFYDNQYYPEYLITFS